MPTISEHINELGEALVKESFPYPDVVCNTEKGIIPRGLIYEEDGRNPNGRTAIIVGINPGQAKPPRDRGVQNERMHVPGRGGLLEEPSRLHA
jgi:hypothetical protein